MKIDGIRAWLQRGLNAWVKPKDSSEARFRQLFEKMPEPVWIVTDNHFVEANPAALAAIGYPHRPRFLHLHPADVSPEYQPDGELSRTKAERMAQLGLEKGVHRFEWSHKRRDGSLFPVEVTLTSIDWLGKPSIYCTWRDISERKNQDKNLRLSQFSVDRATDAIYWINSDGRVFMANQSACAMLGLSLEELTSKTVSDIDVNFTPALWKQHWEDLKQRGAIRLESMQPRADGTVFPVEVSANYISFEGAEYNCAIVRDIGERKRNERDLLLHRAIVDHNKDVVFITRKDGSFQYVNEAACRSLEYSLEEMLAGMTVSDIDPVYNKTTWDQHWLDLRAAGSLTIETLHRSRSGRIYPVEVLITLIEHEGQEYNCGIIRDISERKAAAAELQERTRLLELAQAAAHLGYYLTDLKTRQWISSPMLDEIMGIEAKYEHTVEGWSQLVHPDDRERSTVEFEQAVQQQQSLHHQYRIVRPCDGETIWVDAWGAFEYDEGQPVKLIGTVMDITDRKRAEQELEQHREHLEMLVEQRSQDLMKSEERFRLAMDASRDGLWDWMVQTSYCYYSPGWYRMLGLEPGSLPAHIDSFISLLHPDERASMLEAVGQLLEAKSEYVIEFRMRNQAGGYIWVLSRGNVVDRDADGKPLRALGTHTDITLRKLAELALAETHDRLRKISERVPGVLYQFKLRPDGTFCFPYASDGIRDVYRVTPEQVRDDASPVFAVLHPDDYEGIVASIQESARTHKVWHLEYRVRFDDGTIRWLYGNSTPEREADGSVLWHGCIYDITDRKHAEQEVRELNAGLEQRIEERTAQLAAASAAKTQFLAHMSHELRTPMNAVLGLAQLLEKEPLEPGELAMVRHIRESGDSLLHIINDILDFSKIEAGQLRLDPQPFTLSEVLSRIENLLRLSAETKGLMLEVKLNSTDLGVLVGDPLRLEQILINLTGNAIKFTAQGRIGVSVKRVTPRETGVRVRFEVQDTGIGITPDAIKKLFLPFSQADASITRHFGGTGLGLAISRRLVDLMGGQMGVNSEIGQGSTFWFELPFQPAAEQEDKVATIETKVAPPAGPQLTGLRVLAVDDSRLNLLVVERALKLEGCHVTLAADGQQALQILKAQPQAFDVVLMDIQMPVMDGLTATREIRQDDALAHLPVIALTAGVLPEERRAALEAGVNEFLAKPLDLQHMQQMLSQYA